MMPKDPVMLLSYVNTQLRDFTRRSQNSARPCRQRNPICGKNWRSSTMSTMRKRTSLCKNNQALKKMAEKGVPYVEKTHTGRLFTQSVFLITDRKNHIYNRRNVVKWRKRKSAENGETADLEKEETNMYFGVQMYGVSKEWKQDPEGFLKKIYEAGYRQIEPCLGFRVDARDYGFWIPEDLEQAMPLLAKYHIEVHAVHIFLDEYHYERELAILTELAQKYHISWFVVKSPARLTKDVLDETAARYRELAEELEKAGAGLLIHNEKEDICIRVNGKTAYEYLLEACGEKVGAEVDAGWMYWRRRRPGRVPLGACGPSQSRSL